MKYAVSIFLRKIVNIGQSGTIKERMTIEVVQHHDQKAAEEIAAENALKQYPGFNIKYHISIKCF